MQSIAKLRAPWGVVVGVCLGPVLSACDTAPVWRARRPARSAAPRLSWQRVLPWSRPSGPVLDPGGDERRPTGPSAVAMSPRGHVLVLDRLGGRILLVPPTGAVRLLASIPRHYEELAVSADGRLALLSPAMRRVLLLDPEGRRLAEVSVPTFVRRQRHLSWSRGRVWLATGFQERFPLGGPAVALSPREILMGKREGSTTLEDGRAVAVRCPAGRVLVEVGPRPDEGPSPKHPGRQVPVPWKATAAMLVGVSGNTVCLLLENASSAGGALVVRRRMACLDVDEPAARASWPVEDPGLYVPRRQADYAWGRLVLARPTRKGLELWVWEVQP